MKIFSKVTVGVLSLALAFSVTSGASAQAMSYADLIKAFVAAGIISADKAAMATALVSATPAAASFTKNLTVGSSGPEVTALQTTLKIANATGYFGSATKAAVQAYQTSKGISATGFVGPLTRAALNGSMVAAPVVTTPGAVVTTPATAVNTGVEGTLTVERTSVPNTTVYEGDSMKSVLAIKVQAKVSDINVQRIKLNLGDSTSIYTKIFKTLYVVDDTGKVLVQADLNSNTVVKDTGNYFITLGGFSYNVAKDSTKNLFVKADVYSSVKAGTATCNGTGYTCTITLPIDGVRGVDGAGLDQTSPTAAITQTVSITGNLAESATVDISPSTVPYKASDVVAKDGSANNELDGLALLSFDLLANKADVKVTSFDISVVGGSASGATTTTIYLYDGSTLLQSESVDLTGTYAGKATFDDIAGLTLTKDVKKTLVVKADIRSANATPTTVSASISNTRFVSENMIGTATVASGSATGENMVVRSIGPVFTLTAPTMTASGRVQNQAGSIATTTGSATFTINATALGGDISFGSAASTTGLFGTSGLATTTTTWLAIYKDSVSAGAISANTAAGETAKVAYSIPSSGVTTVGETFTLSKGASVSIPVTVTFPVAGLTQSSYAVQINGIRWSNTSTGQQTSASMLNRSEWRTAGIGLP